jgi:hypothetical protein
MPISQPDQKAAKWCAIGFSILYVLLFFPALGLFAASTLIFDSPSMTLAVGLPIVSLFLLAALSLPLAIFLMIRSYRCRRYRRVKWYCLLPPCAYLLVFVLVELIDRLSHL